MLAIGRWYAQAHSKKACYIQTFKLFILVTPEEYLESSQRILNLNAIQNKVVWQCLFNSIVLLTRK